jgi:hypothetical protein
MRGQSAEEGFGVESSGHAAIVRNRDA